MTIIFIGLAYDITHISRTIPEICDYLNRNFDFDKPFLQNSSFLEVIDNLVGRFAIILIHDGKIVAINDPSGIRPIYYHVSALCLSSHCGLINIFINEPEVNNYQRMIQEHGKLHLPLPLTLWGDQSPYKSVIHLIPNYWLELPGPHVERFFPRKRNMPITVQEAARVLAEKIRLIAERLNQDYNIYLSLTTGFDSRTSLSACKGIMHDITLFSYYYEGYAKETYLDFHRSLAFCRRIAARYNIRHEEFNLTHYDLTPDEKADLKASTIIGTHDPELAFFRAFFKDHKSIHLRSNIYEVIKSNRWDIFPTTPDEKILHFLAICSNIWRASPFYGAVTEYYKDYISRYKIRDVIELGYNYGDLFYAEFRGAKWLSSIYAEPESVIDTFTLINCRSLFALALAIPQELKDKNMLQHYTILHNWPELLEDYKYPNISYPVCNLTEYIDFPESIEVNYLKEYEELQNIKITSYNLLSSRNNLHFEKVNYDSILFGFNTGNLLSGDIVEFTFTQPVYSNTCYKINCDLFVKNSKYASEFNLFYEIYVNDKLYFREKFDSFSGINQFIYIGNSHENKKMIFTIKIINMDDTSSIFNHSILKISNLTFSQETSLPFEEYYYLTSTMLKNRWDNLQSQNKTISLDNAQSYVDVLKKYR